MNILILSWRGPGHPNAGGAELVTMKHASAWVKAGNEVTLLTSYFDGAKERETVEGVNIVRKGGQVFGVRIAAIKYYFSNSNKFDLIVDEFHGIPFFTPFYSNVQKLAVIHEVAKEVWKYNPWPKPLNYIPWILGTIFERFIFLFYMNVHFMTVSKSTKRDLVGWGISGQNITIIENGLDKPEAKLPKNKKKTAIYLGALAADKGIYDALETFSLLYKMDKSWKFYVAGHGDKLLVRYLKMYAKKNNLSNNLKYFGYVSNIKKYELLSKAHVMVNPSVREGWGLVNLEANSVGTPVVGYNVPGICDSVISGRTGVLCKNKNPDCLAEEITKLVGNKSKYKKMSAEAIKWASQFNWEKSTKKSLQLIESHDK